jgi:hypothetical protein
MFTRSYGSITKKGAVWQFRPTEQENTLVHAHPLTDAHEILIIGPSQTKREFARFLREKHAPLAADAACSRGVH